MSKARDAAIAKRFGFPKARRLSREKQDEFEAGLPPRAKTLFQAIRVSKPKKTKKAKK
tara:strand:- start:4385 stop:4558 length:174 start_codon:yes stop_codon:yes gene_type:complete